MTEQTKDLKATAREQLKTMTLDEFVNAHLKDALVEIAGEFGVEDTSGTKQEIAERIVAAADLPDPSLRGESTVEGPVALVWKIADRMFAEAAGDEKPRRKDVMQAAQDAGVTFYTARTQYQAWFSATNGGEKRIADLPADELPKVLRPAEPETEEAEA